MLASPGSGPQNAATIPAERPPVSRLSSVDHLIAYAGLDPRTHHSERLTGQQPLSKRGPGALRHALYLAVLGAARPRPAWRQRYQRWLDRGPAKKAALLIRSPGVFKVSSHLSRTGASSEPAWGEPH